MTPRITPPHASAAAIGRLIDILHSATPSGVTLIRRRAGSISMAALAEELDVDLDALVDEKADSFGDDL